MTALPLTILIVAIILGVVIHQQRGINARCKDESEYSLHNGQVWRQ